MCGKKRWMGGAILVALIVVAWPAEGQQGPGIRGQRMGGPGGPFLGQSVNVALENQDQLELTQDQVAQLQEMKMILDGDVAGLAEEMKTLRESIRNGDVAWDEGQRRMGVLRGELISASSPLQGRVQEIFTVEQHNKLQPLVWQNRPGLGRGRAAQGRSGASIRGRGVTGRGMVGLRETRGLVGPRPGFNGQGRTPALGFRRSTPGAQAAPMGQRTFFQRRGIGGQNPAPAPTGGGYLS